MIGVLLLALLQAPGSALPDSVPPTVRLAPNDYLTGSVTLVGTLAPDTSQFVRADFLVDGVLRCRIDKLPLACAHDFGPELRRHRVQLVVTLATGGRVSDTLESKAIALDETVSVQNVFLPVVVTDRRGRFVNGLTQQSFQIFEDDVSQSIQFFAAESAPLDVSLALDISQSMTPLLDSVKAAAKAFLAGLGPSDRVSLLAFNERVFVLTATETASAIQNRTLIDRLRPTGGTAIFDALSRATGMLGTELRRRGIIIFTDGRDEHSISTFEHVESELMGRDATLYVITFGQSSGMEQQRARLNQLAERTGGRGYDLQNVNEIAPAFKEILETFSHHYLVGYTPTRPDLDGRFRRITVTLNDSKAKHYRVRTRGGYRAVPRPAP